MSSNDRIGIAIPQPRTSKERVNVAQTCCSTLAMTMPLLVDDMADSVGHAYSGMPDRLYVIGRDGRVVYKGGRGPFGFRPGEMEQSLVQHLLDLGEPAAGPSASQAGAAAPRGLDIYWVDTEGGAATLLVTPAGESVLIDCGNPGARDAERIHHVVADVAGLPAIDHLLITHWHLDHYGGVARLSRMMPVRRYYDRGIPDKLKEDPKNFPTLI